MTETTANIKIITLLGALLVLIIACSQQNENKENLSQEEKAILPSGKLVTATDYPELSETLQKIHDNPNDAVYLIIDTTDRVLAPEDINYLKSFGIISIQPKSDNSYLIRVPTTSISAVTTERPSFITNARDIPSSEKASSVILNEGLPSYAFRGEKGYEVVVIFYDDIDYATANAIAEKYGQVTNNNFDFHHLSLVVPAAQIDTLYRENDIERVEFVSPPSAIGHDDTQQANIAIQYNISEPNQTFNLKTGYVIKTDNMRYIPNLAAGKIQLTVENGLQKKHAYLQFKPGMGKTTGDNKSYSGIEFVYNRPFPEQTWVVRLNLSQLTSIANIDDIMWIGDIAPIDKMSTAVCNKQLQEGACTKNGNCIFIIECYEDVEETSCLNTIEKFGKIERKRGVNSYSVTGPLENVYRIAAEDNIVHIQEGWAQAVNA